MPGTPLNGGNISFVVDFEGTVMLSLNYGPTASSTQVQTTEPLPQTKPKVGGLGLGLSTGLTTAELTAPLTRVLSPPPPTLIVLKADFFNLSVTEASLYNSGEALTHFSDFAWRNFSPDFINLLAPHSLTFPFGGSAAVSWSLGELVFSNFTPTQCFLRGNYSPTANIRSWEIIVSGPDILKIDKVGLRTYGGPDTYIWDGGSRPGDVIVNNSNGTYSLFITANTSPSIGVLNAINLELTNWGVPKNLTIHEIRAYT